MARFFRSALLIFLFSATAFSQSKIAPPLLDAIDEAIRSDGTVHALVMLADHVDIQDLDRQLYRQKVSVQDRAYIVITTLQQKALETQGPLLSYLASLPSSEVVKYQSFWVANMIAVEATPAVIMELSARADVNYLQIDGILERDEPLDSAPAEFIPNGSEVGLRAIKADKMWQAGYTGAGTIVMGIDTGVDGNHPALNYKWRGTHVPASQAWFDPNTGTNFPNDCDGHGTHTIGTMNGLQTTTNDTVGVAPGAEWIAAKTLCAGTHTSASIAAFQWAMDPDGNPGTTNDMPAAIGNSWYDPNIPSASQCNPAQNPYINVLTAVEAAGIAVVFSAGNSGPGASTVTSPKNVNINEVHFWATGAVDGNNPAYPIASFSSRGPVVAACSTGVPALDIKPEASAPGVSVRSSYAGGGYQFLSGTSMACPHVVGAIALLKEAHPNKTGHELKMALYQTAVDLGVAGEDNTYGRGIIDVWAAHESLADPLDPNDPENVTAYSDYTTPTSILLNWTDPTTYVNGDPLTDFSIEIFRDGSLAASVASGVETYTDNGLNDGQLYQYTVYAKDVHDSLSGGVTVAWHAGGSPVPAPPTSLAATVTTTDATLTWADPTTQSDGTPLDDLDHINIYRNGVLIGNAAPGVETYTDAPPPGFFYNYTVTAVDNETPPNESAPSNVAGGFVGSTPAFLVWVGPDASGASAASGDSIFDALVANGQSALLTNDLFEFGTDLSIYTGIFVVLGIYSNNHVIGSGDPEGPALNTYVQGGGRIFLEGGDCFNYDPETGGYNIRPWFALNDGPDGSSDLSGVTGLNELSAFLFSYNGENNWMDELQPNGSTPIWKNSANADLSGVFNVGAGGVGLGRAIGVVPSFGGFVDSPEPLRPHQRTMENYLPQPPLANETIKPRPQRGERPPFVKKAAWFPERQREINGNELYRVTPNGIEMLANTKEDLMAAYLELFGVSGGTDPQITVQPLALSDTLAIGASAAHILSISNSGGSLAGDLTWDISENPAVTWLEVTPAAGTTTANQTTNVSVQLNAAGLAAGSYSTTLEIASNAVNQPLVTVPVALLVQESSVIISASPNPLVFPEPVFVNGSDQASLWVKNSGNSALAVSNIASGSPVFSADPTAFSVPPSDSVEVTVTFAPVAAGTQTGSLTIFSNDPAAPQYGVGVQGQGINPPVLAVEPEAIDVSLVPFDSTDVPVAISNTASTGAANLDWSAEVFLSKVSLRMIPFFGPVSEAAEARRPRQVEGHTYTLATDGLFDLQYSNNLEVLTGALGNAGSEFDGAHGYSTRWASNLLHKFVVQTSTLVEQFSIPGVTGLRDLAYDGAFMYGGAALNTIYQMDFETKTLIGTIPSPVAVRHIAYDEGADAFWVGTWDTPPTLVSRTGQVLGTLTTGLTGQYGSAYDNYSAGGPYLWVFDQGSGAGLPQIIRQYRISTGTATGVSHDVASNFPAAAGIAGGLWVGEGLATGKASIGGVLQGTPDMYFAYELAETAVEWMQLIGASSGSVAPGDVGGFTIRLTSFPPFFFQGSVAISSNDPVTPLFTIPVNLDVIDALGEEGEIPTTFDVSRNYPNPFNPSTTIDYQIPQVSTVKIEIYNVLGQKVRTLVDAQMQPGRYQATWDGRNDLGAPLTSGVYIYRFAAGDFKSVQKMILMK